MILSDLVTAAFSKVANMNLPDEEAERIIADAATRAGVEVRGHCLQCRQREKDLQEIYRQREENQRIERENAAAALARANAGAEARQAVLKAAEDATGPSRRRGMANNDLF